MVGWPHSLTGGWAYLLEVVSTGSIFPSLCILAKVIPVGSWEPLPSLGSGTLQWFQIILILRSLAALGFLLYVFVCFYVLPALLNIRKSCAKILSVGDLECHLMSHSSSSALGNC